jgi:hypothetical protein
VQAVRGFRDAEEAVGVFAHRHEEMEVSYLRASELISDAYRNEKNKFVLIANIRGIFASRKG